MTIGATHRLRAHKGLLAPFAGCRRRQRPTRILEAAEREQDVTVGAGDILLVRTGLVRRLVQLGAWDTTKAKPGVHPRAMPFLAEPEVRGTGCDGNRDPAPSTTEEVADQPLAVF
jgi:kynurenine formamidase